MTSVGVTCEHPVTGTRDAEVVVVFHEETLVTFSKLSDELVQEHVEGGEPW